MPHYCKDIDLIESVQKSNQDYSQSQELYLYEECLCILNLTTLETRRIRSDLIEVLKVLKGKWDTVGCSHDTWPYIGCTASQCSGS